MWDILRKLRGEDNSESVNENTMEQEEIKEDLTEEKKAEIEEKKKSICRIQTPKGVGVGFFFKAPIAGEEMKFIVSTEHTIQQSMIQNKISIRVILYNGGTFDLSLANKERTIPWGEIPFFDQLSADLTFIKLLPEELLRFFSEDLFLEMDDGLFSKEKSFTYLNEKICVLQYPKTKINNIPKFTFGRVTSLLNDGYSFTHNAKIYKDSPGAPILLLNSMDIIGVNFYSSPFDKIKQINKGTLIGEVVNKLQSDESSSSYFEAEYDVKPIYLYNEYWEKRGRYNIFNSDEGELSFEGLNGFNCKLYINDKLVSFRKKFKEEGKYKIKVVMKRNELIKTTKRMFYECSSLISIDMKYFDTSEVEDMNSMFCYCSSLPYLKLSSQFKTENVKDMESMFYSCRSLTSLDLSHIDTKNVQSMNFMIAGCIKLSSFKIGNKFITDKVKTMWNIFCMDKSLTYLDLTQWNTKNVENMQGFFAGCTELITLILPNPFVTEKVKSLSKIFCGCTSLTSLNLSTWDTKEVDDMSDMFYCCTELKSIEMNGKFNTKKVRKMNKMFTGCESLIELDLSTWDTNNVEEMNQMFERCSSLNAIYISDKFNTWRAERNMKNIFNECFNLDAETKMKIDPIQEYKNIFKK
ncbi:MAG: DUF285 domain-containing protein [archaeon]|nr:DUF285 domain-containing protein [archaeon]